MIKTKSIPKISDLLNVEHVKNLVPGTLIYKGKQHTPMRMDLIYYNDKTYEELTFKGVDALYAYTNQLDTGNVWLNVVGLSEVEKIALIGKNYKISKLYLEQVINITKHSMFKDDDDSVFCDLQMIYLKEHAIEIRNISVYLKGNMVITFQDKDGDIFEGLRDRVRNGDGMVRKRGGDYLFYAIMDDLADNYMDVIESIKFRISVLEENMINDGQISLKEIHEIRKVLFILKLSVSPFTYFTEKAMSNGLFPTTELMFLDNISDHIKALTNELLLQKELVDSVNANYMLDNSNEMNKIMTTLTIFSAIFIPLSFLAGVFGMNFEFIPGLDSELGFYVFAISCVTVVVFMITFFKVKKWF